ncbi:MAG: NAD(+) diphosphatase [Deltaproteobacteria bacterium]|nr:MAG: NAD(+) diphosphatase [Deltaproteobacteria bacterium]
MALPTGYRSPLDLPFNNSCLAGRFRLAPPDADPGGSGFWLLLRGGELLVGGAAGQPTLPEGEADWQAGTYLGRWDGRPCRLARMGKEAAVPEGLRPENLLAAEPALPIDLLSLGGLARMVLHWERHSRHCPVCAAPLARLPDEWGKRCAGCTATLFPQVAPCAIVLVRRPGEVLLTRKPEWAPDRYGLVAGFLEFGECLEEAAVREVREETGIRIDNLRYLGSQCWPFPSQLMAGFVADYAGGEIVVDRQELADARWFPVDALPVLPPKRSIARYILDRELGPV